MSHRLPGLLVVGTDTGVGKTWVASAVARRLRDESRRVGVLKPAATGAGREGSEWRVEDAEALIRAVGGEVSVERVSPFVFEEPLAPCVAARRAGLPLVWEDFLLAVEVALDWWSTEAEVMVVEGVGGFLCPLTEETTVADLAVWLDYPVLLIARRGLGTLNHTLLTVEAIQRRALRLAGIVLNSSEPAGGGSAEETNAEELARRLPGIPILAELVHGDWQEALGGLSSVDWWGRVRPPRRVRVGLTPAPETRAAERSQPGEA